jgi:hypothetical protein
MESAEVAELVDALDSGSGSPLVFHYLILPLIHSDIQAITLYKIFSKREKLEVKVGILFG